MDIRFKQAVCYNTGREGDKPRAWCLHIMAGTFEGTEAWFQNPNSKASSTYSIAKDGRILQNVKDQDFAWANGISWLAGHPMAITGQLLDINRLGAFVKKNIGINPNRYTLSIEFEGYPGQGTTEAQYQTAARLISLKNKEWNIPNIRERYLRHADIDYINKGKCGLDIDVDKLMNLVDNVSMPLADVAQELPEIKKPMYHIFINLKDVYMTTYQPDFLTVVDWVKQAKTFSVNGNTITSNGGDKVITKLDDAVIDSFTVEVPTIHVSDVSVDNSLPDNALPVGEQTTPMLMTVTKEQIDQMVQDSMKPVMLNLTSLQQENTSLTLTNTQLTQENTDLKETINQINLKVDGIQKQLDQVTKERDDYKTMVLQAHADNPIVMAHNRGEVIKYKAAKIFLSLYKPDLFATLAGIAVVWVGYVIDLLFKLTNVSDAQHVAIPGLVGVLTYGGLRAVAKLKATTGLKSILNGDKLKQEAEDEIHNYEMSVVNQAELQSVAANSATDQVGITNGIVPSPYNH